MTDYYGMRKMVLTGNLSGGVNKQNTKRAEIKEINDNKNLSDEEKKKRIQEVKNKYENMNKPIPTENNTKSDNFEFNINSVEFKPQTKLTANIVDNSMNNDKIEKKSEFNKTKSIIENESKKTPSKMKSSFDVNNTNNYNKENDHDDSIIYDNIKELNQDDFNKKYKDNFNNIEEKKVEKTNQDWNYMMDEEEKQLKNNVSKEKKVLREPNIKKKDTMNNNSKTETKNIIDDKSKNIKKSKDDNNTLDKKKKDKFQNANEIKVIPNEKSNDFIVDEKKTNNFQEKKSHNQQKPNNYENNNKFSSKNNNFNKNTNNQTYKEKLNNKPNFQYEGKQYNQNDNQEFKREVDVDYNNNRNINPNQLNENKQKKSQKFENRKNINIDNQKKPKLQDDIYIEKIKTLKSEKYIDDETEDELKTALSLGNKDIIDEFVDKYNKELTNILKLKKDNSDIDMSRWNRKIQSLDDFILEERLKKEASPHSKSVSVKNNDVLDELDESDEKSDSEEKVVENIDLEESNNIEELDKHTEEIDKKIRDYYEMEIEEADKLEREKALNKDNTSSIGVGSAILLTVLIIILIMTGLIIFAVVFYIAGVFLAFIYAVKFENMKAKYKGVFSDSTVRSNGLKSWIFIFRYWSVFGL